jgi:hypothetical protein
MSFHIMSYTLCVIVLEIQSVIVVLVILSPKLLRQLERIMAIHYKRKNALTPLRLGNGFFSELPALKAVAAIIVMNKRYIFFTIPA